MAEYIIVKYKVSTTRWVQRIRLIFLIPFFFILAIIFLIGSYASVLGAICVAMACFFIFEYIHWRKLLKKVALEGGIR